MKNKSKRKILLDNLLTKEIYSLDEGIKILKQMNSTKFIESVEAHFVLNLNPKYANQQLRSSVVLPYGTGKKLRIAVFIENEFINEVTSYGAFIAGYDNILDIINKNQINFDLLITTPSLMSQLTKVGKILGPKGLMPSLKSGTITTNLKQTLEEFNKGKFEYRLDKNGNIHLSFGKISFTEIELQENFLTIYNSIEKNKPSGAKGKYFKACYICSTMSPSIKLDLNSFLTK